MAALRLTTDELAVGCRGSRREQETPKANKRLDNAEKFLQHGVTGSGLDSYFFGNHFPYAIDFVISLQLAINYKFIDKNVLLPLPCLRPISPKRLPFLKRVEVNHKMSNCTKH